MTEIERAQPVPLNEATISATAGHDWSGWRGGHLQGVALDANPPLQWSRDRGVRWRTRLTGQGNSSPVVWGDKVFITSALQAEDNDAGTEDSDTGIGAEKTSILAVQCYDRKSGQQRWQQVVGRATGRTHLKNGYASSTITCDGEHVVAYFRGHGLTAFSPLGDKLWHCPLRHEAPQWGAAASPLLVGDLVVQLCDGHDDSSLTGVNKYSGEVVWRTSRKSEGSWTSPILIQTATSDGEGARYELIVNGSDAASGTAGWLTAYDPASGKRLWRARGVGDVACPTAIALTDDDGVTKQVISTSGANGPIFAVRTGGRGDVTRTHVEWRNPKGGAYVPTGVVADGYLYTISDNGKAACYDVTDGSMKWSRKLRDKFSASLVAAADRIYAVSESGTTFVYKASPRKFQLLAANRLHAQCLATPAVVGDDLMIRTDTHLYCIGRTTADFAATANPVEASPSDIQPDGLPGKSPPIISVSDPGSGAEQRDPPSALNATP